MNRLNDAIDNMLRETLARGDAVAPGWRDEIRAIVRDCIAKEREACAQLVDVKHDVEALEIHGGQETIDVLRSLANKIRMRSSEHC